jgi:hypothetical protein
MRRSSLLIALPFVFLSLVACESATDLEEVSMEGRWDAVGSIRELAPDLKLTINADANGIFTGNWSYRGETFTHSGSMGGVRTGNSVEFTLTAFQGGSRTFAGQLTDLFRMSGLIDLSPESTAAVFRRASFSP